MMKIADSFRLWALFGHATPENGGTSHAVCMPMVKIADSLRLWALFGHATHENGGASHAVCMPMMKIADSLRLGQRTPLHCVLRPAAKTFGM